MFCLIKSNIIYHPSRHCSIYMQHTYSSVLNVFLEVITRIIIISVYFFSTYQRIRLLQSEDPTVAVLPHLCKFCEVDYKLHLQQVFHCCILQKKHRVSVSINVMANSHAFLYYQYSSLQYLSVFWFVLNDYSSMHEMMQNFNICFQKFQIIYMNNKSSPKETWNLYLQELFTSNSL